MKVSVEIESCRDCPHVTCSSWLHDDAFTSAPLNNYWYCTYKKESSRDWMDIEDSYTIPDNCPLKK